jgi:DNA invertase Pin-like site-specific DNA recombinase
MSRISKFGQLSRGRQLTLEDNRVVFYIRASTKDQVNSLDAQKLAGKQWANSKNLEVVEIFTDAGVSAIKHGIRDRPNAKAMFAYMKKHGIVRSIFIRPIRAFRSTYDFCTTSRWMQEQGIIFSFMDPEIDSSTHAGNIMLQLMVSIGEMECETRAAAQSETYDSLRDSRIARSTQEPYGWKLGKPTGTFSRASKRPLHYLIPIPAEQAVLRHIQDIYQHGPGKPYGKFTAIAELLNSHRIPTKTPAGTVMRRTYRKGTPQERSVEILTDGQWKHVTVKSVLAHAVVAADAELPDGIPTFQQAIAMLASPQVNPVNTVPESILADF